MRYIHNRLRRSEKGFTLIELLVVVIIIGILAAIAIPVFLSQREKAWDAAAQSDLRGIVTAEESYYTSNDAYTDNAASELEAEGFKGTDNVVTDIEIDSDAEAFCAVAKYDKDGTTLYVYNSEEGKMLPDDEATLTLGDGTACPGDPTATTTTTT